MANKNQTFLFRQNQTFQVLNMSCQECGKAILFKTCSQCISGHFQDNFKNWTSGDTNIDEIIQKSQLGVNYYRWKLIEWIEYSNFENIEHFADGRFASVYKNYLEMYLDFSIFQITFK